MNYGRCALQFGQAVSNIAARFVTTARFVTKVTKRAAMPVTKVTKRAAMPVTKVTKRAACSDACH